MRFNIRTHAIRASAIILSCVAFVALSGEVALSDTGDCSQPISSGAGPAASDCLFILKTAVGSETCEPACICAPKGIFPTTSTDALLCLRKAVGQNVSLDCPCGVTTTSTTTTTSSSFFECDVRFRMSSSEAVASLSFEANYQLIFGIFVGDGAAVECTEIANADFTFSNDHANKILTIGMTKEAGLPGPANLAECVYSTNQPGLDPEDIRILNVSALSAEAEPVDATVEVVSVTCP